jgi:hypothetical protein
MSNSSGSSVIAINQSTNLGFEWPPCSFAFQREIRLSKVVFFYFFKFHYRISGSYLYRLERPPCWCYRCKWIKNVQMCGRLGWTVSLIFINCFVIYMGSGDTVTLRARLTGADVKPWCYFFVSLWYGNGRKLRFWCEWHNIAHGAEKKERW